MTNYCVKCGKFFQSNQIEHYCQVCKNRLVIRIFAKVFGKERKSVPEREREKSGSGSLR